MHDKKQMKIRNRIHVQISVDEVAEGDYIEYDDRGRRMGKVAKVAAGLKPAKAGALRKGNISTEPMLFGKDIIRGAKRVNFCDIVVVWRKRVTTEDSTCELCDDEKEDEVGTGYIDSQGDED